RGTRVLRRAYPGAVRGGGYTLPPRGKARAAGATEHGECEGRRVLGRGGPTRLRRDRCPDRRPERRRGSYHRHVLRPRGIAHHVALAAGDAGRNATDRTTGDPRGLARALSRIGIGERVHRQELRRWPV